jgi:PAS domain S-box-containing protein
MTEDEDDITAFPERPAAEMPALAAAFDWAATPLGPRAAWSPALALSVDIVMASGFPMALRWGADFVLIYNDGYCPILGDKHPAAFARPIRDVWPEVWPRIEPTHRAIFNGTSEAVFVEDTLLRIQRRGELWEDARFTLSYSPVPDATAPSGIGGVFVTAVETTLRVAAEREMEQAVAARTRERDRLWQTSQDLQLVLDAQGIVRAASPAWTRILGWLPGEIIGRSCLDLVEPEFRDATQGALARAVAGVLPSFEVRCLHRDGGARWISWVAAPDEGLVYASGRDIDAEKAAAAELAAAQAALRQAQKMEAIGQLTGGIAHDFNNLLAGITGNLELLGRRVAQGRLDALPRHVDAAQEGARRAAALTQRLLAFSRRQTLDPRPVDINRLVRNMAELIGRTVGPTIAMEVVGAAGLWPTLVDQNQLENALLNLCINARDAMPDGGRLTIETANKWLDDRAARDRDLPSGQYISLCVTDTGTGMAPEVIERAFDPFFTTKPLGQGTGLGLSMIYGFARQSGGQVRIYSEVGDGTTMCLYLPRFAGEVDAERSAAGVAQADFGGHGETVLVVDDEEAIRTLVADVLGEAGYHVITAEDGPSGLRRLASDARVDLLITDVGLPGGMNGRQVADAARVSRPGLKVLFITGYAENAVVGNGRLDPGMQIITKPFSIEALGARVREMIDR